MLEEGIMEARRQGTQLEGTYNLATQEYHGQLGRAQVAAGWALIRNVWQMESQKQRHTAFVAWREALWNRKQAEVIDTDRNSTLTLTLNLNLFGGLPRAGTPGGESDSEFRRDWLAHP